MPTSIKGRKFPPEPLTKDEINALLKVPSQRCPTGIRNKALIVVLYRAQLRISEALSLKPKDFDPAACTFRVMHGKGDKYRLVGIDEQAVPIVQRWLDARKGLGINGHAPLFCTLKGDEIETAYIRALMPRLQRKAGIEKRVHAHGLRHTGAFELANEGVPMHVIQKQLGHENLATTATYVSHLAPTAVVDRMRSRSW